MLYDTLVTMNPSVVVKINRAVAVVIANDAQAGLQILLNLKSQADGYYLIMPRAPTCFGE